MQKRNIKIGRSNVVVVVVVVVEKRHMFVVGCCLFVCVYSKKSLMDRKGQWIPYQWIGGSVVDQGIKGQRCLVYSGRYSEAAAPSAAIAAIVGAAGEAAASGIQ
jgi:hypothetical protein